MASYQASKTVQSEACFRGASQVVATYCLLYHVYSNWPMQTQNVKGCSDTNLNILEQFHDITLEAFNGIVPA